MNKIAMYTSILSEHPIWNKEAEESLYTDDQRNQDRRNARIRGIAGSGIQGLTDGAYVSGRMNLLSNIGTNMAGKYALNTLSQHAIDNAQSKEQENELRKLEANRHAGNAAGTLTGLGMLGAQIARNKTFGNNRLQTAAINAAAPIVANNALREYLDYRGRKQ